MSRTKKPHTPKFRHHKATGQGFVELNGRRHYLGKFELPETEEKYHKVLAEWLANRRTSPVESKKITVLEIVDAFWTHATTYYRAPDGGPSKSLANFKSTLNELRKYYGGSNAAEFGPRSLKALRGRFIEKGHCRKHVNQLVSRVKQIFRWAVSEELIPSEIIYGLDALSGLQRGRSEAPETSRVRPVPMDLVDAIKPYVSRQIWALVQLQILTAARPGELVIMRPVDIDTTGRVWLFRPTTHKTAYRELARIVYIGPKAQRYILPFLQDRAVVDFLFSPEEAEKERRAALSIARTTPLSCGNVPGSNRKSRPERKPGKFYTNNTYRRAVERACTAAGVPLWTPGRLRHNAASFLRREYGLEAAQLLLGHARADVTQIYAEVSELKAIQVAEQAG